MNGILDERTAKEERLSRVNRNKEIALEIMPQEGSFKQTLILRLHV